LQSAQRFIPSFGLQIQTTIKVSEGEELK